MSGKSFIWVTFQKEGLHKYPEALTDPTLASGDWLDVKFLGTLHRHIFHFRVDIQVTHDNRELEFIRVKRQLERLYSDGTLQLDFKSCEMIARDLHIELVKMYSNRDYVVEVSEDHENGAKMYFNAVEY